MATELKRMTFVVTPEMEEPLNSIKKEMFYNRTQSDMIRELVSAGVRAFKAGKTAKEKGLTNQDIANYLEISRQSYESKKKW